MNKNYQLKETLLKCPVVMFFNGCWRWSLVTAITVCVSLDLMSKETYHHLKEITSLYLDLQHTTRLCKTACSHSILTLSAFLIQLLTSPRMLTLRSVLVSETE